MGNCLSMDCVGHDMLIPIPFHGKSGYCSNIKNDLRGSTFSHYSLTSDTSFLDLYPALRYIENDQTSSSAFTGSCCVEFSEWRHSSLPLIDDDDTLVLQCAPVGTYAKQNGPQLDDNKGFDNKLNKELEINFDAPLSTEEELEESVNSSTPMHNDATDCGYENLQNPGTSKKIRMNFIGRKLYNRVNSFD